MFEKIGKLVSKLKDWQILMIAFLLLIIFFTTNPFEAGVFITLEEFMEFEKLSKLERIIDRIIRIIKGVGLLSLPAISGLLLAEYFER